MQAMLGRGLGDLGSWRELRLSTKLMALLLGGALLAIFTVSQQNEARSTDLLTRDQSKLLTTLANTLAVQVESQLSQYSAQAVAFATDPEVRSFMQLAGQQQAAAGTALLQRFHPILAANPDYRLALIMDLSGRVVLSEGADLQGANFAGRDFFTRGLEATASQPFIADISLAEDHSTQITYVSYPLRDDTGATTGVAAIRLVPDHLAAPLRAQGLGNEGRQGFLVNRQGLVLANSANPALNYRALGTLAATQLATLSRQFGVDHVASMSLDGLAKSVIGAASAGFAQAHLLHSNEDDVVGYAPIPFANQHWAVMVAENKTAFTGELTDMSRSQLINTLILALVVGGLVIFAGRVFESTERQSLSDPLTGLGNRRFFEEILLRELRRAQRADLPVSLVIIDIDHFKAVNDTYGHNVGDEVLEQVASIMLATTRSTDFVARQGGEEFVVLLPETSLADARAVADKVRRRIGETVMDSVTRPDVTLKVTVSAGVAAFPRDGETGEQLILRADRALYHSKQHGRNRVSAFTDLPGAAPLVQALRTARG